MGGCVAITRGGWGDCWRFESREAAFVHPLIQYGDVIVESSGDIFRNYNILELDYFLQRFGNEELRKAVRQALATDKPADKRFKDAQVYADGIWKQLQQKAKTPPASPNEICRLIKEDRLNIDEEHRIMAKKQNDPATGGEETETKAAKTGGRKSRSDRYNDNDKIFLGTDKAGNKYSAENNPKRPGSATHTRFGYYEDGLTVGEFKKRGGQTGDLDYDLVRGYINIERAPAEPVEGAAE